MIGALTLALVMAVRADDPCAAVAAPGGTPDPAAAAEYRAVGDAERAAGSRDTAAAAYRAALARDPSDGHSRDALAELCSEQSRAGAFERGLERMRAGDRAGAVSSFEEARAERHDPSASLLEGICLYEMGEDDRARPLLEEAAGDPAHRDTARFFLGLVALHAGRSGEATALLEASAADRRLAPIAMDLARMSRRDGRIVLSVLADGGFDSNADLTPDEGAKPVAAGDASGSFTALGLIAPFGDTGPFVRGSAVMRGQVRYDALDLRGGGIAAGWQGGRAGRYLLGELGWEGRELGGKPYLSAERLLGAARLDLGSGASAGLTYFARLESFSPVEDQGYSGLRHFAEADASFALDARSKATLAWHGALDAARDRSLAWTEQGPRVSLRLAVGRDDWLGLDGAFTWREYDEIDRALSVRRSDRYVDLAAFLEREIGERWTLRGSLAVRKALSNVPEFRYTKVVPMVGLAWTVGIL